MPKDRYFSLFLDNNKPKDKECKVRGATPDDVPDAKELALEAYLDALDDGKLREIGKIYSGPDNLLSSDVLAPKCVYVYIGGTCYKICT